MAWDDVQTDITNITYNEWNNMVDRTWGTQEAVNVTDPNKYGAYSDGTHPTATTTAIQDAVNEAKNVFIPEGTFSIETAITVPSGTRIVGAGINQTTIKTTSSVKAFDISNNSIELENFEVDFDDTGTSIEITGCSSIKVKNLKVHNSTSHAFIINGVTDIKLIGNEIYNAASSRSGLHIETTDRGLIKNNYTYDNGIGDIQDGDGIYVAGGTQLRIINNLCKHNNRIGIVLEDYVGTQSDQVIVEGNLLINNGVNSTNPPAQIWSETNGLNTISHNICWTDNVTNENRGILSSHNEDTQTIITGNSIYGTSLTVGILPDDNDIVTDNYIESCDFGLFCYNKGNNLTITHNRIKNIEEAGIALWASSATDLKRNRIQDNIIENTGIEGNNDYSECGITIHPDITLHESLISGNIVFDSQVTATTYMGIYIGGGESVSVESNIIKDTVNDGIHFYGCNDSILNGNSVINPGTRGLNIGSSASNTSIKDNYIESCNYGIFCDDVGDGLVISQNQVQDTQYAGIEFFASASIGLKRNQIKNNMIKNSGLNNAGIAEESGIFIDNEITFYDSSISGNTIVDSQATATIYMGICIYHGENISIKDNTVNNTADDGIYFRGCDNSILSGNNIVDPGVFGLNIGVATLDIISHNSIKGAGRIGILVNDQERSQIIGNTVETSQEHGIRLFFSTGHAHDFLIANNMVKDNNQGGGTYYGIDITNGDYIYDFIITGNRITGSTQTAAINLANAGNCRRATITSNNLQDNANSSDLSKATWHDTSTVKDNIGYTTEKSGNASVSDADTLNHGLDETPTFVNLTTSVDKHIVVATAVDATTITVGLHDDTGTRITTNETVYWEARA